MPAVATVFDVRSFIRMEFIPGNEYSRPDIKQAAGLGRDAKGGDWDTGIVEHDGEFLIFSNIGTAGLELYLLVARPDREGGVHPPGGAALVCG